jgi:hypothetical protein
LTNLSPFKENSDRLPQLEPRQQDMLDFLKPDSSMDGLPLLPPQYLIPNHRLKERLERQKNWGAMTPEEILLDESNPFSTSSTDDRSKPAARQSKDKDKQSESDYSASGRRARMSDTDSSRDSDWSSASRKREDKSDSFDDEALPANVRATERELQEKLRGGAELSPFANAQRPDAGFSTFSAPDNQRSRWLEQVAHNKAVMEQFKQTLQSPSSLPGFLNPTLPSGVALNPFESSVDSKPGLDMLQFAPLGRSPFSQSDGLGFSFFGTPASITPTLSGDSLGSQSSLFTQPTAQPAQQPTVAPPTPTFVFPKRAFQ